MTIWKYSPGKGARFWDFCLENDLIAMGWDDANDLTWIDTLEEMTDICDSIDYSTKGPRTSEKQLWDFKNIKEKNIIVAYGRGKILGIGIVVSPYFFDNSRERAVYKMKEEVRYPHRYRVKWVVKREIDVTSDSILYGKPPAKYGTLSTEDTIHEIVDDYTISVIKRLFQNELFQ